MVIDLGIFWLPHCRNICVFLNFLDFKPLKYLHQKGAPTQYYIQHGCKFEKKKSFHYSRIIHFSFSFILFVSSRFLSFK